MAQEKATRTEIAHTGQNPSPSHMLELPTIGLFVYTEEKDSGTTAITHGGSGWKLKTSGGLEWNPLLGCPWFSSAVNSAKMEAMIAQEGFECGPGVRIMALYTNPKQSAAYEGSV